MPAVIDPIKHPIKAELTAHPSRVSVRLKYFVMKGIVPEITAVSKPKSKPPNAATKLVRKSTVLEIPFV